MGMYWLTYSFITERIATFFYTFVSSTLARTQHITDEKLKTDHSLSSFVLKLSQLCSLFLCTKTLTQLYSLFVPRPTKNSTQFCSYFKN